jgi:hypothetical protein
MIGLVLLALLVGFTVTANLGVGLGAAVIAWGVYAFSRDLMQGRM